MSDIKRAPEFDPDFVRTISTAVYVDRLGGDGPKMIAEDGMEKVRSRAISYDALTKSYLRAFMTHPPGAEAVVHSEPGPEAPPPVKRGRKPK